MAISINIFGNFTEQKIGVMKHFIEIDDSNKTGKNLLSLIKTLSDKGAGIDFISNTVEDKELVLLMKAGVESGIADRKSVLKKLGIE